MTPPRATALERAIPRRPWAAYAVASLALDPATAPEWAKVTT